MGGKWKELPLSELYDFRSGISKPRSEFGFGYGFLSFKTVFYNTFIPEKLDELVNSTVQEREAFSIKRGDIFLTRTSETMEELGMSCVALKDYESATFNGFTKRLRPKINTKIDPEFAGYFFRSPKFRTEITAMSSLSTRASLNNEMLGRLKMALPSFKEQAAIGHTLKSFDDKIELNQRMNDTLEAMARAIFKSWFVDFDPVRAKSEGRDTGLPSDIAMLFPDKFVESELGKIPKGWKVGKIGEEFNLTMGQSPPGETYNETGDGLPFFQGRTDFGFRYPQRRMYCNAPTRFANPGDTLISVRAPVGDINMASEKCCVGRGVAAIRHKNGSRSNTHYLMQTLVGVFTEFEAGGTVFGCMNKADFEGIKYAVPPLQLIDCFEKLIYPIDQSIENHSNETANLTIIRDSILPKLISGDIIIS